MKLRVLQERELILAIRKDFSRFEKDLILGIGDDAAAIKAGEKYLLLTKDLLIEDIHFITALHPPYFLGRKSMSVNLSDIAAMGGKPKYVLLGLGLPSRTSPAWLEQYFSGFKSACREWGVVLVGGDLSQSKKVVISVTIIGQAKNIIQRKGARPGHFIFVSGELGNAGQGLLLLKRGFKLGDDRRADPLLKAFLNPVPQLALAQELSRFKLASSMIDVSDGLSVDLLHLCEESSCGAVVKQENLPLSRELCFWQKRPYELALHSGEDYELLFSVPPGKIGSVARLKKKYKISCIGKMVREKNLYLLDPQGKIKTLKIRGYQHFKV
jgi:thiamine-monophosphate kinase